MIEALLQREIDVGSFASAVYAVGTSRGIECKGALGHAVAVPYRIPATVYIIYDCASLTKPLVTGILVLQAIAEGRIALDDEYRGFTYRELLSHTSGLTAWLPLYALGGDTLQVIEERGREVPRGSKVIYSDLNFILLHAALTEIFGDYRTAARERIFAPLGLHSACFNPPRTLLPCIAATEWGQRYERDMCAREGFVFAGFRDELVWGEVHDGNSYYAGGTAGNAGLFATVADVFRIAQAFVRGELVPRDVVAEAVRNQSEGLELPRGLGWQLAGPGLSPQSFGHTGFTGTSVWVDGEQIFVLLTNRVHPCAAPIAMQKIRGEFHRRALS